MNRRPRCTRNGAIYVRQRGQVARPPEPRWPIALVIVALGAAAVLALFTHLT